ncbi:hypothetical protein CUMW_033270 [Citrus unshiu]|nr:hypothetical protein CUMW_033270 [Citrus unshiu]
MGHHGSHDLSQSTADFNDTVACHLSYTHLQSADERNETNPMRRWPVNIEINSSFIFEYKSSLVYSALLAKKKQFLRNSKSIYMQQD